MKTIDVLNNPLMRILCVAALSLAAVNCGSATHQGEDYGDILETESGLILVESEHTYGWGRSDCLVCHNLENIHLVDNSGLGIDVEAISEQTQDEGEECCAECHGTNGAE